MDTRLVETPCFLCGSAAKTSENPRLGFTYYHCCQCGQIHLSHAFIDRCESSGDLTLRQKIASLATEWNLNEYPQLVITDSDSPKELANSKVVVMPYKKLYSSYPQTRRELYDRVLKNLAHLLDEPGCTACLIFDRFTPQGIFFATGDNPFEVFSAITSTVTEMEKLGYLEMGMCQVDLLDSRKGVINARLGLSLTNRGWERVAELENIQPGSNTPQAYVSMLNDKSRSMFFENGIKPAIESAHHPEMLVKAQRLKFSPADRFSCNHIFSEILASLYMVADVTGFPTEVYHEAGFAQGSGIPVIWLVDRHFQPRHTNSHHDDRGLNFIVYNSPSDLAEKLRQRIQRHITL